MRLRGDVSGRLGLSRGEMFPLIDPDKPTVEWGT